MDYNLNLESKEGGIMFGRKGRIDVAIQKTNYAPGDTISGNVTLTLKKPVEAREVSISLIGTAWVTTYSGTRTGLFDSGMRSGGGMMMGRMGAFFARSHHSFSP